MTLGVPLSDSSPPCAVYSTVSGGDIRKRIEKHFLIERIADCALLQPGFNDVYEISLEDGGRYIARLGSRHERGEPNVQYETAILRHLKHAGAKVAAPRPTKDGTLFIDVPCQEGLRQLVIFEFLPGKLLEDNIDDIKAMAAELAHIHVLSKSYHGPESKYVLDLNHLLRRPLARILAVNVIDQETRDLIVSIAANLEARAAKFSSLTIVACHGDCHGYNTMMNDASDGSRTASFFDFDDGGPSYLAYDLAVFLWNRLLSRQLGEPDEKVQTMWAHFIEGYRSVVAVPAVDFEAIAMFVAMRHFWLIGEYASRVERMGTQMFQGPWIRDGFELAKQWASLEIPIV